jgi:hypothetical protein
MRLEDYLQHKIEELAESIIAEAPVAPCQRCSAGDGYLVFEGGAFYYACDECGTHWLADSLEITESGQLTVLEWAD